jgi:cyclic-di-GMP-binding protein
VKFTLEFKRADNIISLSAPDDYKISAIYDTLLTKLGKRGVPIENLKSEGAKTVAGGNLKQEITLTQGIDGETAKKIVKFIKDAKLKKVQASIQSDQVRVASPSRDELQGAMALLKGQDFGIELKFGNYR